MSTAATAFFQPSIFTPRFTSVRFVKQLMGVLVNERSQMHK